MNDYQPRNYHIYIAESPAFPEHVKFSGTRNAVQDSLDRLTLGWKRQQLRDPGDQLL